MADISEAGARERILRSAIDLIRQKQDVSAITVREIAQAAGVGVGLINYHFRSKDKLMRECVQLIIGEVIATFPEIYQSLDMSPLEKLRFMSKSTARFLAANPGISRVSILTDLMDPVDGDNSMQSIEAYLPVLKQVLAPDKSETELRVITQAFLGAVQVAFLHNDVQKKFTGLDFYNEAQRNSYIDIVIDAFVSSRQG